MRDIDVDEFTFVGVHGENKRFRKWAIL